MPTLASIDGRSLVADAEPVLGRLFQAFGTPESRERNRITTELGQLQLESARLQNRVQAETLELTQDLFGDPQGEPGTRSVNQERIARITALNPELGRAISQVVIAGDKNAREAIALEAERGGKNAAFVMAQPDFVGKQRAIRELASEAAARGEPLDRFIELSNLTEDELDLELQRMQIASQDIDDLFASASTTAPADFTKGSSVVLEKGDGSNVLATPVFNKRTGSVEIQETPVEGELASRLGQTPAQQMAQAISEATQIAAAQAGIQVATAGELAAERERGGGQEQRAQTVINDALDTAKTIPILKRSIQLLESVETGGVDRAILAAKQLFGVESADEAELAANLARAVLAQMRPIFGAQFTEREGDRLNRIEAGVGKSTQGNIRLLQQLLRAAERDVRRAQTVADERDDQLAFDAFEEALTLDLGIGIDEEPAVSPAPVAPEGGIAPEGRTAVNPQTGERMILRDGVWQPM